MARCRKTISIIFLTLMYVILSEADPEETVYDIREYDTSPDTDITEALIEAFGDACEGGSTSRVLIPRGNFMLGQVKLNGPCRKHISIEIQGSLVARMSPEKMDLESSWVSFQHIDHLRVFGGGVFDGRGGQDSATCGDNPIACDRLPYNLKFHTCTNSMVQDITSKDSKSSHVFLKGCKNISFQRLTISSPEDSANTDGFHVSQSYGVNVTDSNVLTGDNCVTLASGSFQVLVQNVTCGSGKGISVGSLGKYENEEPVKDVKVKSCTISDSKNGVSIKTRPASFKSSVSKVVFEDIRVNNVANPVLIDQYDCRDEHCDKNVPSRVKVNGVSFNNIRGISSTPVCLKLACSYVFPCENIRIIDIDLKYSGKEEPVSQCSNVGPQIAGKMNPPACSMPAIN